MTLRSLSIPSTNVLGATDRPPTSSTRLVTLAVLIRARFSATTAETFLVLLFMVIAGPYLTHATIRAARVRERGDWRRGGARTDRGRR